MCPTCVCAGQKRALDFLQLVLLEVVSYPTCGCWEVTVVLWKSRVCSELLSHLQPLSKNLKQECVCVLLGLLNLKCSKK